MTGSWMWEKISKECLFIENNISEDEGTPLNSAVLVVFSKIRDELTTPSTVTLKDAYFFFRQHKVY